LFARADLGIAMRSDVMMVPEHAIVLRADGSVVFRLVNENEVERVQITTGVYRDGWVEISDGLTADDLVVVRGQNRLVDGSVVEIREADGSLPGSSIDLGKASRTAQVQ
jgi:membrane fusion protein (multidrug efflux system)